jgi:hypothetical protein
MNLNVKTQEDIHDRHMIVDYNDLQSAQINKIKNSNQAIYYTEQNVMEDHNTSNTDIHKHDKSPT